MAQQRAAIPPLDQQLRQNIATLAVLLGEPPARLTVRGGSLSGIMAQRVVARPAVGPAAAAPGHPRGRGAACRRQRQCRKRARRAAAEHLAHRPGRLRQRRAAHAVRAAVGDLFAGRKPDPAGVRRLPAARELDLRKGQRTELLQLYRKAIISGFADVERALIAVRDLADQERLQTEAVATARRAYELSETQLRAGTIDITTVLNTQRTLFQAQDQLVVVRLTRLQAIVSLFQALGGGWVLPEEIANDRARGRRACASRTERHLMMNLRRILPIAVGIAVVAAVGAYVVHGQAAAASRSRSARARIPGSARAGAGRARRASPTCRSISMRSATPAR